MHTIVPLEEDNVYKQHFSNWWGFSGITAALEAAEVGHEVFLIEKSPFLGGRVSQLNKYFPKLCPPSCGLEIQFQRLKKIPT